ncbi:MAG: hypothetical protein POELPBGB_00918 [Bacteroidia bacterium]|nr:hypothetical protein [Bacteroidia bacterium]
MKKQLTLIIPITMLLIFLFVGCGGSLDCQKEQDEYSKGFSYGGTAKLMNDSYDCYTAVNAPRRVMYLKDIKPSPCYCDGFNDGRNGKPSKY